MSSANRRVLHLPFQTRFLLLFFLSYCTWWSFQNHAGRQRYFAAGLMGKAFCLSLLSMMLAMVSIDGLFGLRRCLVLLVCCVFLSRMGVGFGQVVLFCFTFCIYNMIMWFLSFCLSVWYGTSYFQMATLNLALHSWGKCHLYNLYMLLDFVS